MKKNKKPLFKFPDLVLKGGGFLIVTPRYYRSTTIHKIKFFENLKKQLKKSELQLNFGPEQIGHLIPLTVGHRDRPTEKEVRYMKTVMGLSGFLHNDDQTIEDDPSKLSHRGPRPGNDYGIP